MSGAPKDSVGRPLVPFFVDNTRAENVDQKLPKGAKKETSHEQLLARSFDKDGYFTEPTASGLESGAKKVRNTPKKQSKQSKETPSKAEPKTPKKKKSKSAKNTPAKPPTSASKKSSKKSSSSSGAVAYADPEFLSTMPDPATIPLPSFLNELLHTGIQSGEEEVEEIVPEKKAKPQSAATLLLPSHLA